MPLKDLFRPKWKHSDWFVRLDAVPRVTEVDLLVQIARSDPHPLVRKAAVDVLGDESVLAEIAKSDGSADVGLSAVRRLKSPALLAEVASATKHERVSWVAVAMLDDQQILATVARTGMTPAARMTAARKLTSQPILAEIARTDTDGTARKVAVELLADERLLAEIAKADSDRAVRKAAVEKLTDMAVLAEIAKQDMEGGVRIAAAKRLALEGVPAYELGTDDLRRLLAWLMKHRGCRVRWACRAPQVWHQGEWTIETPDIREEGAYVYSIPRDYVVVVSEGGARYEERHKVEEHLNLPAGTHSTLLVDGPKVVFRLHYKQGPVGGIGPVTDERDANYVTEWSFELLEQPH